MNYLKLYEKWATTGYIEDDSSNDGRGDGGLCNTVIGRDVIEKYFGDGSQSTSIAYYGYNGSQDFLGIEMNDLAYKFTELRQYMVLLLAAINGQIK